MRAVYNDDTLVARQSKVAHFVLMQAVYNDDLSGSVVSAFFVIRFQCEQSTMMTSQRVVVSWIRYYCFNASSLQ